MLPLRIIFSIFVFVLSSSFAARSISVPTLQIRISIQFPEAGGVVPNRIGAWISTMIVLRNISNVAQTVQVRLDPGTEAYTGHSASTSCLLIPGVSTPPSATGLLTTTVPYEHTLSLPPNGTGKTAIHALYNNSSLLGPTPRFLEVLFLPAFTFTVLEDSGAIVGSISAMIESTENIGVGSCQTQGAASPLINTYPSAINRAEPIIYINGGRPF